MINSNDQKQLWEKLAKKNSRYYINSDKGKDITEEQFRESGEQAYKLFIAGDKLVKGKSAILDFGCGTGRLTEFMAKDFERVIGVDISSSMIAQGKNRLKDLKNVEFLETDGNLIQLPDKSVDFVFSYLVFQHIKNRQMVENAFKEIFRILNKKGIFKVLLRSDKQQNMSSWWSGVEYNEKTAKKLYEKTGFKLLKIEYREKHAFWLWLEK